jgi:hypothetical protein
MKESILRGDILLEALEDNGFKFSENWKCRLFQESAEFLMIDKDDYVIFGTNINVSNYDDKFIIYVGGFDSITIEIKEKLNFINQMFSRKDFEVCVKMEMDRIGQQRI